MVTGTSTGRSSERGATPNGLPSTRTTAFPTGATSTETMPVEDASLGRL